MRKLAVCLLLSMVPWVVAQAGWAQGEAPVVVVEDTTFETPNEAGSDWKLVNWSPLPPQCLKIPTTPLQAEGLECQQKTDRSSDGDAKSFGGYQQKVDNYGWLDLDGFMGTYAVGKPYDPSESGPIYSLDAEFQLSHQVYFGFSSTIEGYLFIHQDGKDFLSKDYHVSALAESWCFDQEMPWGGWQQFGPYNLEQGDFCWLDGDSISDLNCNVEPDFSSSGGTLYFGFALDMAWHDYFPNYPHYSGCQARILNRHFRVDEFEVTVNTLDTDSDGVADCEDNCISVDNPNQCDFNQDGYGNRCDCDFDDNSGCGVSDYVILVNAWDKEYPDPAYDEQADMDADGSVGSGDYSLFLPGWGQLMDGKSGLDCAGVGPYPCGPEVGTCTTPPVP